MGSKVWNHKIYTFYKVAFVLVASVRLDFFLKILSMSAVAWDLKILQACLRVSSEGMWQLELVSKLNLIYETLWTEQEVGGSLLHLMLAMHALMPVHSPLVWCVYKIAHATSVYDIYGLEHWKEENETKSKNIDWIVDHFSLTFANLTLAWMLCFDVWLQSKGKILSFEWIMQSFGIYQTFPGIPLRITAKQLK